MNDMNRGRTFQMRLNLVGMAALFFTLGYGNAGWGISIVTLALAAGMEYVFKFRESKTLTPYLMMLLSPVMLVKYASVTDFQVRVTCFVLFIYILNVAYKKYSGQLKFSLVNAKPAKLWIIAFMIFSMVSTVLYLQDIHLSGDEPHYLMIAQSLTDDGDFDLKNNFDNKTYKDYIPVDVRFHGGEYKGKLLSFHLPGMSFLLVPFYWLFKLSGGAIPPSLYFRLAASIINAFFAMTLFLLMRRVFVGKNITGIWLLFLLSYPLVFHSVHLYPELPAATLMMAAYYTAISPRRNILLCGLFLGLIPWFHVKYFPALAVMGLWMIYDLIKPLKGFKLTVEKVLRLVLLVIFPIISMVLLVLYSKVLYNAWSPTHIFPRESYFSVPVLLQLKVFFAYFLDQRDGLLFYAPLFFLAFAGMRKKINHRWLLVGTALAYVGFHAFTSVRGAYSPAGRPLMFVSWIFLIFIAHFYFNIYRDAPQFREGFSFKFLAGMSVFVVIWLAYYPLFMYQPVFSYTLERPSLINLFMGGSVIELWKFFPSFLTSPENIHPANFIWIGLLLSGLLYYYLRPLKRVTIETPEMRKLIPIILLFLGFTALYCIYPHVHLLPRNKFTGKQVSFFNNSKNFKYVESEQKFRVKTGNRYDIYIDRKMKLKDRLTLRFTGGGDDLKVTVWHGKQQFFETSGKKPGELLLNVNELGILKLGDKQLSHLGFDISGDDKNSFLWLEIE